MKKLNLNINDLKIGIGFLLLCLMLAIPLTILHSRHIKVLIELQEKLDECEKRQTDKTYLIFEPIESTTINDLTTSIEKHFYRISDTAGGVFSYYSFDSVSLKDKELVFYKFKD